MNKVLCLSFVCAMTLFSSCEREQCLCKENRQVENNAHGSETVTPDAPQKPGASELKVDEFGEYITDGNTRLHVLILPIMEMDLLMDCLERCLKFLESDWTVCFAKFCGNAKT